MKGGQEAPVGGPSKSKSGKSSRAAPSSADLYWACTGLVLRASRAEETGAASTQGAAAAASVFSAAAPAVLPAPPSKKRRGFAAASIWAGDFPRFPGQIAAFPRPCGRGGDVERGTRPAGAASSSLQRQRQGPSTHARLCVLCAASTSFYQLNTGATAGATT